MTISNTLDAPAMDHLLIFVYGLPGTGKSTFATTFPKPLLIDFEDTAKCFGMRGIGIDRIVMDDWFTKNDKRQLKEFVKDYETIVFDPLGEAMELMIKSNHVLGDPKLAEKKATRYRQRDGFPTPAGWGEVKKEMRNLMSFIKASKKNLVMVLHAQEQEDEQGHPLLRPKIQSKVKDDLMAMADMVAYLENVKVGKKTKRLLRVDPAGGPYFAKDRTDLLPESVEANYDAIMSAINNGSKRGGEKMAEGIEKTLAKIAIEENGEELVHISRRATSSNRLTKESRETILDAVDRRIMELSPAMSIKKFNDERELKEEEIEEEGMSGTQPLAMSG